MKQLKLRNSGIEIHLNVFVLKYVLADPSYILNVETQMLMCISFPIYQVQSLQQKKYKLQIFYSSYTLSFSREFSLGFHESVMALPFPESHVLSIPILACSHFLAI